MDKPARLGLSRRDLFSSLAGLVGVFRCTLDAGRLEGVSCVETAEAASDPQSHIVIIRVKGHATPEHMVRLCQTWKRVVKDSPWRLVPTVVCDDKVSVEFHNGELVRTTHLVELPKSVKLHRVKDDGGRTVVVPEYLLFDK